MQPLPPIPDERPLSAEELRLARWMLEHGEPEARDFLPQLARTRVVSRCPCGCATIDLQVDGFPPPRGVERVLGDFYFEADGEVSGAFIYACDGGLAGIEVYGLSGDSPKVLPPPDVLRPMSPAAA